MDKKCEKNYRIFRVEAVKDRAFPKKITMTRIYAENDDDAYTQLKDYIRVANKEYRYYVEPWTPYSVILKGKKIQCEDFIDAFDLENAQLSWYVKLYRSVLFELEYLFVTKPKDLYYKIRDVAYLLKHKQQYDASWNIDTELLHTLKFNISILKNNKHTYSWAMLRQAFFEKYPDKTDSDAKKYFNTHYNGYDEDIEKRAAELEQTMFDTLLSDIDAYNYYIGSFRYGDENDAKFVEIDKKLRNTLPLIKGSYDRYDHAKLETLCSKYWNRIWETVRKYGREFND